MILFTWAFHALVFHAWWLASGTSGSRTSRYVLVALSRSGGGVSFASATGFMAKTQAPPLLLGLRASLYQPNQRETIAMGDCYILCGQSGVSWSA